MLARPHVVVIGLLSLAIVAEAPPIARAESVEESREALPEGYRELVAEAVREYTAHHFAEARALFHRAHRLYPNARTFRGLGAAEFELRNYGESVHCLEQALASTVRPLDPELRARTERLLVRARGFVARLQLSIQPASTIAMVDGVPVVGAREILLEVGDHTVEFRAPGYLPERRKLTVHGGELRDLHVVLTLRVDGQPSARAPSRPALYKSPWLWAGVGVVAAGVATTLALTLRSEPYDGGSTGVVLGRR
jgi:tetratricopeptide (TPR) repeat protein